MKIRSKTILIIIFTLAFLLFFLYLLSSNLLMRGFIQLEEQDVRLNLQRVHNALYENLNHLYVVCGDYSAWNDTYQFITDGNQAYIESNLTDSTFSNLKVNLIIYADSSGKIIYKMGYDIAKNKTYPLSGQLIQELILKKNIFYHPEPKSSLIGIVRLSDGLLMLASRPIVTSEEEGPVRGTLIFGQFINNAMMDRLAELTHLKIEWKYYDALDLPEDFEKARFSLKKVPSSHIHAIDINTIFGYTSLWDIDGKDVLLLRIKRSRDFYKQGLTSLHFLLIAILVAGINFGAVILILLDKLVLSRLTNLSQDVALIGESKDLSKRVSVRGKDELKNLASVMNQTFESLEIMQNKLKESEERFRNIANTTPMMIWIADSEGRMTFFNKTWLDFTGSPLEKQTGHQWIKNVHPEDVALLQKVFLNSIAQRQRFSTEFRIKNKNGDNRWLLNTGVPQLDSEGAFLGLIGSCMDITEIKEFEQKQNLLLRELANANQELTDFAYIVSHDLKAPLRAINSMVSWIASDYSEKLDSEGKEMINVLINRVKRMHNLIEGILHYSRVGRVKEQKETVRLNDLVKEIIESLAAPEHIEITVQKKLPDIFGEVTRISQVFQNLLSNAIKFMDKPKGQIKIDWSDEEKLYKFSIEDNGPGIEEKYFTKIFQIFQTLAPRDEFESTGIGLTVVKKIIETNGGKIWVESKPGSGSTFIFTWPKP